MIEVAQLLENELLVVIKMVSHLKKQRARPNREAAAQLVARAQARAAETRQLTREELLKQFGDTLDALRAEAIAKGTALEGEWEG